LAGKPRILLLDEPFAAVDAQTRSDLQDLVRALWLEHGMTTVLVTHDIDEAVYTSERVIVLGADDQDVILDTEIDLPRERDQISTRSTPAFAAARTKVLSAIQRPLAAIAAAVAADVLTTDLNPKIDYLEEVLVS
jgi:NitT/TauT family transport system ATP-binding protein